ncbi:sel1 repeat family protein [bacterium]|nr:sel1 repeat family protein [bacterium]
MKFDGKEVEERDIEKIKYLARIGDVEAQRYLAWLYKHGEGVKMDFREAEYWDEEANGKKKAVVFGRPISPCFR